MMDLQLRDRRVLITGSTKGIGFTIAQAFAAQGAHVILNGRSQASSEMALTKLKAAVPQAKAAAVAGDLSKSEGAW